MVTLTRATVLLATVAFAAWLGQQGSAKGARPKSPPSMASATVHFPEYLYFRQLQPGVDHAVTSTAATAAEKELFVIAAQMKNFVYLVGDRRTGDAVVIDGAWDPAGIRRAASSDGMTIRRFVATHYHWDHIGGPLSRSSSNMIVPGIKDWASDGVPISMPTWERTDAAVKTGTPLESLVPITDLGSLEIGGYLLQFVHTPGHSPGSMVVLVKDSADGAGLALVTGDTVFPGSCGRLDLPESQPQLMWKSLQRVAEMENGLPIFPGHGYSGWGSTVAHERKEGLLRPISESAFNRMMGLSADL